jgi:hypothetical protein
MQKVCKMDSPDLSGAALSFIQLIVVHKVGCLMVYSWGSQVLKKDNLTASLRLPSAAPAIHKLAIGYGVDQGLEMCHKKQRQHHSTLELQLKVWSLTLFGHLKCAVDFSLGPEITGGSHRAKEISVVPNLPHIGLLVSKGS